MNPSGERSVARMSRGTGMPKSLTRIPDQSNGTRRLPAASVATRSSVAVGLHGTGLSAKHTLE